MMFPSYSNRQTVGKVSKVSACLIKLGTKFTLPKPHFSLPGIPITLPCGLVRHGKVSGKVEQTKFDNHIANKGENLSIGENFTNLTSTPGTQVLTKILGLNFLLRHLTKPIFPRRISCKTTEGRQVLVDSYQQMLAYFEASSWLDCRISAFNSIEVESDIPSLIFIDVDHEEVVGVSPEHSRNRILVNIVNRIISKLNIAPTILWTGNGYHVYVPLEPKPYRPYLKQLTTGDMTLSADDFLRWSERYLANFRSDSAHNPSMKSALLRVPYSYNSKALEQGKDPEVKLLQRWNLRRARPELLLGDFLIHLRAKQTDYGSADNRNYQGRPSNINWIDKLLQYPISDGRNILVWTVLAPYFVNIKKVDDEAAKQAILRYFDNCNSLTPVKRATRDKVRSHLYYARSKGSLPYRLETLKEKYPDIYREIQKVIGD